MMWYLSKSQVVSGFMGLVHKKKGKLRPMQGPCGAFKLTRVTWLLPKLGNFLEKASGKIEAQIIVPRAGHM